MPNIDTGRALMRARAVHSNASQSSKTSSPIAFSVASFVTAVEPDGGSAQYEEPESYQSAVSYTRSEEGVLAERHESGAERDISNASPEASDEKQGSEERLLRRSDLTESHDEDANTVRTAVTLTPIATPQGYPPLNFRPALLEPMISLLLMILYILLGASVGVILHVFGENREIETTSENLELIAQYLPGLTATVSMLLFRETIREAIRMVPYVAMADHKGSINPGALASETVGAAFSPWMPFWPRTVFMGCLYFGVNIASILVAAKSTLIATQQNGTTWSVYVRPQPAYFLMCCYGVMALCNLLVTCKHWSRSTGLRWDPISLTDFIALFASANALDYFHELEFIRLRDKMEEFKSRNSTSYILDEALRMRIGYWRRETVGSVESTVPTVVYGIGVASDSPDERNGDRIADSPVERSHFTTRRQTVGNMGHGVKFAMPVDCPRELAKWFLDHRTPLCKCLKYPDCYHYPYYISPGLGTTGIVFWECLLTTTLFACIYALVKGSYLTGFSIPNTWEAAFLSNSPPNNTTLQLCLTQCVEVFNSDWLYTFIFRALPTQLAGIFAFYFLGRIDTNMRFMQPFLGMFERPGTAEESISLSYLTASALSVPLEAFKNGHYKVAWFSILHTVSPVFPVIVSGSYTMSKTSSRVNFTISKSGFVVSMIYVTIYWVTLPFAWPRRYRRMPRFPVSLADLMGMCHQSQVVTEGMFDMSGPKMSRDKLHATVLLRDYKYLFGWYLGRDGKRHLGFDVAETEEQGPLHNVRWVPPKPSWIRSDDDKPSLVDRLFRRHKARIDTLTGNQEHELDAVVQSRVYDTMETEDSNDELGMHGALATGREL